jgi:hypothetical protein
MEMARRDEAQLKLARKTKTISVYRYNVFFLKVCSLNIDEI